MKKLITAVAALCITAAIALPLAACSSGSSAYDIAVENGFNGTEQEWLDSLKGEDGAPGKDGANGQDGANGPDGEDGQRGSMWFYGDKAPAQAGLQDVLEGDMYLCTADNTVWYYENNAWKAIASLSGEELPEVVVATPENIADVLSKAEENDTVTLSAGVYGGETGVTVDKALTFVYNGEVSFTKLTVNKNLTVSDLTVENLTVNDGATLTVTGKVRSAGAMTISGAGTLNATQWAPESGKLDRMEYAAIYSKGTLKITGTTVTATNIATGGDFTVDGGAKVTVLGKDVKGPGQHDNVNGVHSSGYTVTVSGEGTVLNVVWDSDTLTTQPAAFEADQIIVDNKAELNIKSNKENGTWLYAVWFSGQNLAIKVTNGAKADFEFIDSSANWCQVFGGGNIKITIDETSSLTVSKVEDKPMGDYTEVEGEITMVTLTADEEGETPSDDENIQQ